MARTLNYNLHKCVVWSKLHWSRLKIAYCWFAESTSRSWPSHQIYRIVQCSKCWRKRRLEKEQALLVTFFSSSVSIFFFFFFWKIVISFFVFYCFCGIMKTDTNPASYHDSWQITPVIKFRFSPPFCYSPLLYFPLAQRAWWNF